MVMTSRPRLVLDMSRCHEQVLDKLMSNVGRDFELKCLGEARWIIRCLKGTSEMKLRLSSSDASGELHACSDSDRSENHQPRPNMWR